MALYQVCQLKKSRSTEQAGGNHNFVFLWFSVFAKLKIRSTTWETNFKSPVRPLGHSS
jgi:hypothetical protein